MGVRSRALCLGLALASFLSSSCSASPTSSKLLYLVPPGAQIVAGFENYHDEHHHGQLLLTTRNNRLDLADWQAMAGVDHRRAFQEIIEVASSERGGHLPEHLLLVAGRFDRDTIFHSLLINGATEREYQGHTVILVEPFAREKGIVIGTRWLIILDDSVALFGTPGIVIGALNRFARHADVDMVLRERLSQLPRDVSSWNVLSSLPGARTEYTTAQPASPWSRFLDGAEVLIVGARFGEKIHVHFLLHAAESRGADFFRQKTASFADVFAPSHTGSSRPPRLGDVALGPDRVQGSIQLSKRQFDAWGDWTNNFGHAPAIPERQADSGQ